MMAEMLPMKQFKAIYVVDLCKSLCREAANKVRQKGWTNVHVIECDACTFEPPEGVATLVTFSYSLTSEHICHFLSSHRSTLSVQGKWHKVAATDWRLSLSKT